MRTFVFVPAFNFCLGHCCQARSTVRRMEVTSGVDLPSCSINTSRKRKDHSTASLASVSGSVACVVFVVLQVVDVCCI